MVPPQWDGGRLFGASAVFFFTKTDLTRKRKIKNRSEGAKTTVSMRATNGPWQKTDFGPPAPKQNETETIF